MLTNMVIEVTFGDLCAKHHAFDWLILKSRWEVNHLFLLILTIILCPGVGILIIFFKKMSKSPPYARPPLGLDIDRCITLAVGLPYFLVNKALVIHVSFWNATYICREESSNSKQLDELNKFGKKITTLSLLTKTQLLKLESFPSEFSVVSTSMHCHYKVSRL